MRLANQFRPLFFAGRIYRSVISIALKEMLKTLRWNRDAMSLFSSGTVHALVALAPRTSARHRRNNNRRLCEDYLSKGAEPGAVGK